MYEACRILSNSRRNDTSHVKFAAMAVAVMLAVSTPAAAQPMPDTAPRAASPAPPVSQYRVNAGDELDVFVWGEERMQRSVRVQPDGTFAFPLAGTIKAVGRSVTDIAAEIRERIAINYRSTPPDVTVSVRDCDRDALLRRGQGAHPGQLYEQ